MSIMQDFEQARKIIGAEKYNSIEKYLNEVSPKEKIEKYEKELNEYGNSELFNISYINSKMEELQRKHGVIFLNDVIYNPEEWKKFEKWYNKNYMEKSISNNNKKRSKEAR